MFMSASPRSAGSEIKEQAEGKKKTHGNHEGIIVKGIGRKGRGYYVPRMEIRCRKKWGGKEVRHED